MFDPLRNAAAWVRAIFTRQPECASRPRFRPGVTFRPQVTALENRDVPTNVTIGAIPGVTLTETSGNTAAFLATRDGDIDSERTIYVGIGGTATHGQDFASINTQVTFAAGSATAPVFIDPTDDSSAESTETVTITIMMAYPYTITSPSSATVNILDNEPTVSVKATDRLASEEDQDPAEFTFTREGSTTGDLVVTYMVGGTATAGPLPNGDYTALSGTITILDGSESATISILPHNDGIPDNRETVVLSLPPMVGGTYHIGTPTATVILKDKDRGLNETKKAAGTNHEKAHQGAGGATGANVRVGVIEQMEPDPENPDVFRIGVDRAQTNLPADRLVKNLDYRMAILQAQELQAGGEALPNDLKRSDHAALVADIIGSADAKYLGVAKGAKLYVASSNTSTTFMSAIDLLNRLDQVNLFNVSLGSGNNDNGNATFTKFVDWFARTRGALFVVSAGNNGVEQANFGDGTGQIVTPADNYNGITVGALASDFKTRTRYSSYLTKREGEFPNQPNSRGLPMILAPGGDLGDKKMSNGKVEKNGTSHAAPHVTGIAALLVEKGLALGGGDNINNHLAIKSIILNSARKRFINGPEKDHPFALDNINTDADPSDKNYLELNADGTVKGINPAQNPAKTDEWTPSSWSLVEGVLQVESPLDDEQGTGVADAQRALLQHAGGKQAPGNVTEVGWNVAQLAVDESHEYKLNVAVNKGTFITATLTWDRVVNEKHAGGAAGDGKLQAGDTYEVDATSYGVADYNLFVYQGATLIAKSVASNTGAAGDNIEHLHIPVPADGAAGDYRIVVKPSSGVAQGVAPPHYAVAWWTTKAA